MTKKQILKKGDRAVMTVYQPGVIITITKANMFYEGNEYVTGVGDDGKYYGVIWRRWLRKCPKKVK